MRRILSLTAVAVLATAANASACLKDSSGTPVVDSSGGVVNAGSTSCTVALEADVVFTIGSAVLSPAGKALLDSLDASSINLITGYASIDGSESSNLALSKARAQAVADYLKSKATVVGAGETTQFGSNLSANRVVILS